MTDREKQLEEEIAQLKAMLEEKEKPTPKRKAQPDKGQACRAITVDEFKEIMDALHTGGSGFAPNPRAAAALYVEAHTGMRISDITQFRMSNLVSESGRRRLNIVEQKTQKWRRFTVNDKVYIFLSDYCRENNIGPDEIIFDVTPRSIQRALAKAVDWIGLDGNIGTHSFRKLFATKMYIDNDYDIALVQELLQHASAETTRRYLTISSQRIENALENFSLD